MTGLLRTYKQLLQLCPSTSENCSMFHFVLSTRNPLILVPYVFYPVSDTSICLDQYYVVPVFHGTVEADLPFQSHLECSSSQNPGLHPFYPIGQCFQPLHLTQDPWARHLSQSKSLWIILFPSVGPAANLPGPLNMFTFFWYWCLWL